MTQTIKRFQARRNDFEHGGASKTSVTFEPFVIQTSNLQFWKWQAKSQKYGGAMAPWLHMFRRAWKDDPTLWCFAIDFVKAQKTLQIS